MYTTKLAAAILSLGNVLVMSRLLGPEGRGDVVFLITIGVLASNLANLGVQEASANLAGTEPSTRRSLATNSVLFAASLGWLAAGFITALVAVFPAVGGEVPSSLRWLVLAIVPALILRTYLRLLLQADYGFGVTNVAWLLSPAANFVATVGLGAAGVLTVTTAISVWVGAQLAATAFLIAYVSRRSVGFGRPDLTLARRMFGFGARVHLGQAMTVGNYRLDQWFLGAMVGSRELGLYSVAVAWAEALFYLPTTLVAVQRPKLVRATRLQAARASARVLRVATVLSLPGVLAVVLLAPVLTATLFGAEFRGATDDLRVLALGAFGIVAVKLLSNALTAQREPMLATAAVGVAFVVTVVLDVLLIPSFGGLGAAVASTLAYTAGGLSAALITAHALGISMRDFVPRPSDVTSLKARALPAFRRSSSRRQTIMRGLRNRRA